MRQNQSLNKLIKTVKNFIESLLPEQQPALKPIPVRVEQERTRRQRRH